MTDRRKKPARREPTLETARNFGERVRAAYLQAGLNRSQLVRALGVAQTTVFAWEAAEVPIIKPENLHSLSVVTGVSTSYLLGEDETVTEAEYREWTQFLATDLGQGMTRDERTTLGSMRFARSSPPSVARYAALLFALRGTAEKAS